MLHVNLENFPVPPTNMAVRWKGEYMIIGVKSSGLWRFLIDTDIIGVSNKRKACVSNELALIHKPFGIVPVGTIL